jgi:hypothetical protein
VEYLAPTMNGSANSGRGRGDDTCCVKQWPRAAATRVVGGPAVATWAAAGWWVGRQGPHERQAGSGRSSGHSSGWAGCGAVASKSGGRSAAPRCG